MKRRVRDIVVMLLSFLVLLALAAGAMLLGVETLQGAGEPALLRGLTAWLMGSGVWGSVACVAAALLALVLSLLCLWRVFPHRTASQRGYVMQKNENGSIGVSIRAIEGLIRTCIDKHEAIAKADITVEECRDGIAIGLHIIQAAGVNIPLSVGALQKQIKQYVTACTGVDVYKIRVMVENDENIPVASSFAVQDVAPLPTAEEAMEQPRETLPAQPVVIPATEPEQVPTVPDMTSAPQDAEEDSRPLHQRLFGTPEQPAFVPAPPEMTAEADSAEDAPEADEAAAEETIAAEEAAEGDAAVDEEEKTAE